MSARPTRPRGRSIQGELVLKPRDLVNELKKAQATQGLTDAALATRAKVTPNDLRRIKSRPASARLGDLTALCEALGVEIDLARPGEK